MFLRLAVFLLEHSPVARRFLWRWWYGRLAAKITSGDWTFMNYGFVPASGAKLTLQPADEPDRLCIQLYEHVVSPAALAGARVLEVGSGRGGGASYVARCHRPAEMTGLDFSGEAVAWARRRHAAVPNLTFVPGDAENLPFPDTSFDAVINVESSHCYGHVDAFFREAARVLRPGGHFLYADLRPATAMPELAAAIAAVPAWDIVAQEDITEAVTDSLVADEARKRQLISEYIPARMRKLFGEFAGLAGTEIFDGFRERKILYRRFACRKRWLE